VRRAGLLPGLLGIAACVSIGEAKRSPSPAGSARRGEIPSGSTAGGEAKLLVNQLGYFPGLAKLAVLRAEAEQPLEWQLLAADGQRAAYGKTQPAGQDLPSGDRVHVIDFTPFRTAGKGYVLAVGAERSHPFAIGSGIYRQLKVDALAYYYHNRSGIEIAMPYAGQAQWARPAGHLSDRKVACAPEAECSYSLDVSGGWYDAGDHGKYVVNAGIAVWTLLDLYERALHLGKGIAPFADGTLNIPERGNQVPDLLDEVRWELDFLLKMQVPDGEPKAGMVHHKVHDESWTGLGLAPHEDAMRRLLYPVSTAATLNLAAVAAQAGRIWKTIDAKFSARCVAAAEKAWAAAGKYPNLLAKAGGPGGGGPYSDAHVEDEFYWAAAELYLTTKRAEYRKHLEAAPDHLKVRTQVGESEEEGVPTSMTWQDVAALGTLSLAVVPGALSAADQKTARNAVVAAADAYLGILKTRGYRVPIDWGKAGKPPWGSNSCLLNNLIVLALAGDFTGSQKYVNGVAAGMDYLLGRNPLDQSYITGHGARPLHNPHHRFWARQANPKYPPPPPGALSGGPNAGLQDPYVKAHRAGCVPEKCFADHIESYSTNEVAINWNAPLAWVLYYLDEKGGGTRPAR
jgi:endoglucanase